MTIFICFSLIFSFRLRLIEQVMKTKNRNHAGGRNEREDVKNSPHPTSDSAPSPALSFPNPQPSFLSTTPSVSQSQFPPCSVLPQVLLNSPFFLPKKMPPSISPFHPADLEAKTKILPSGKLRKPENQHQLNKCKLQELVQFDCEVKGHKKHKNGIVVCAPIVRVFRR